MSQPPIDPRTGLPRRATNPWVVVLIIVGACGVFGLAGIAILAALLVPSFATARDAARKTSCMSNAKMMSTGLQMYAQDYDTRFPLAQSWQTDVAPYGAPNENTCPTRTGVSPAYAFNRSMSGKSYTTIEAPNTTPLIFESSLGTQNASDQLQSFITPHKGVGNVGFADGSTRSLDAPPKDPTASFGQ